MALQHPESVKALKSELQKYHAPVVVLQLEAVYVLAEPKREPKLKMQFRKKEPLERTRDPVFRRPVRPRRRVILNLPKV